MYLLVYTFIMASGQQLVVEREAHTRLWRPVQSLELCHKIAAEHEARHKSSIALGNGVIVDVTVTCARQIKK